MVAYADVVAYEEGTHGCVTVAADRALYGSAVTVSGARVVAAGPGGIAGAVIGGTFRRAHCERDEACFQPTYGAGTGMAQEILTNALTSSKYGGD